MRLAVWTTLAPQRGEVAESAGPLVAELARHERVVAVVRDDLASTVEVPEGATVVAASEYRARDGDVPVYHVADDVTLHGYLHERALSVPGVLVLRDPALVALYLGIGGGPDGAVFREEARINRPDLGGDLPTGVPEGPLGIDALALLMSRRLVESSAVALVGSRWAAGELVRRSPEARVLSVPEPVARTGRPATEPSGAPGGTVGLFGVVEHAGRLAAAVEAFRELAAVDGAARLLVAVRPSSDALAAEVQRIVAVAGLGGAVTVVPDARDAERRAALLQSCDAVVAVDRHDTGATSRVVLEAFAAGRVVIVPGFPQYAELDERFCWRVPVDPVEAASELRDAMRRAVVDPAAARIAGLAAWRSLEGRSDYAAVAGRHVEIAREVLARGSAATAAVLGRRDGAAVNAIASWEATTGLTEAARRAVRAMRRAGVGVALEDYDYGAPRLAARWPPDLRALPTGRPHDTDLYFLNLNELHVVPHEYVREPGRTRRVVASWFWELAGIPLEQRAQIERVDEIWVASRFVAEVFRGYTSMPVHVVPCVVEPEVDTSLGRADFGLPSDRCLFFFNFDASSTLARKNPLAVVEAYRRAFTPRERSEEVGLVMKTMNLVRLPEARLVLDKAISSVGGALIDADLAPSAVAALTAACDVYVSLHRGEGFGLGIAEAMALGKPAIATAYSGNLDFMDLANSCLVGYSLVEVDGADLRFNPDSEHVYTPGQLWADPDVDEAARRMRLLYESPRLRDRLGAAGAASVASLCSSAAVGARMRELLGGR
ncbi:MAG: glycosyltransferase [Actinomycetota bacterium]|nr:glycosyltransferase [Actinomycetota bacterium]